MMLLREVAIADLSIGDVVRFNSIDAYPDATVKQITDSTVTLVRPYIATADFLYTGGVITYIGQEEIALPIASTRLVLSLVRRSRLQEAS